jgi:hypothetical protein
MVRHIGVLSALSVLAVAGCSTPKEHPPVLGDCVEAGCMTVVPPPGGGSGTGGSGGSAGGSSDAGTCGQVQATGASCQVCMDRSCCSENQGCSADHDCLALANCLAACAAGDAACVTSCSTLNQAGAARYDALVQCVGVACNVGCITSAGDGGASCGTLSYTRATCGTCINQACCSQALACSVNTDCVFMEQCAQSCLSTDKPCRDRCQTQQDGVGAFIALDTCMFTSCPTVCP